MNRKLALFFALAAFAGCSVSASVAPTNGSSGGGSSSGASGGSSSGGSSSGASGGSSSGASGGSSSGGSSSGASGGSSSGASGGPADSGTDAPPAPVKKGQITVGQTATLAGGQTFYSSYASAYFYEAAVVGPSGACTITTSGACTVTTCTLGGTTGDAGTAAVPNAGTLTITGGSIAPSFVLTPTGANGAYSTAAVQAKSFDPGDTLTVSATGGDVPAFSGKTVTAPADLTLLAPTFDASARTTLARSQDLPIQWSGATTGSVQATVSTTQLNVRSVSLVCAFPAAGGAATIPAALMGQLDRADGSSIYGSIVVVPSVDAPFTSADWNVVFHVTATGKSGLFTATD